MKKDSLRIVYLGTPDFAVTSLNAIEEAGFLVVGVVTMPDKPAGRGQKLKYSPVKEYALSHNLPLLQPQSLKHPIFLEELKAWQADVQVVVAFRMLPEVVWNMPKYGTINAHASLLPQYRGAAPINWAVINGDDKTGVTTFQLKHAIDTGDLLVQKEIDIQSSDNAGSVHDKLSVLAGKALVQTLEQLINHQLQPKAQDHSKELKAAPKIFKEDCLLDFAKNPEELVQQIKGLSPYPAAFLTILDQNGKEKTLKIFDASTIKTEKSNQLPQLKIEEGEIHLLYNKGVIRLLELQISGKKRMNAEEFLRGNQKAISNSTIAL